MSEIKFNNLELRKDIRAIVPNIDDSQLDLIEISVIHLVDVYFKAKFNQQQKEIERLKKFLSWEQEEAHGLDKEVTFQLEQLKQAQAKAERYEKAIKECIDRLNEGGPGTRSFVYEKLKEVMGGTECMGK